MQKIPGLQNYSMESEKKSEVEFKEIALFFDKSALQLALTVSLCL